MKTKVTETQKVQESLDEAQGRATARTLTPGDIAGLAVYGERRLEELGLAKAYRSGAKVYFSPPKVANSYSYRADGTYATVTRGVEAWYLTEVYRAGTGNKAYGGGSRHSLQLTPAQQIQLINGSELYQDVVALPASVFHDAVFAYRLRHEPDFLSKVQITEKEPLAVT